MEKRGLFGLGICFGASRRSLSQDTRNQVGKLKAIWDCWTEERQNTFTAKYGDIALLLLIEVDEQLLKAIILFWDSSYRCFTFNQEDLTPTVEEYSALLRISPLNPDKVFWKKAKKVPFRKKLA